MGEKWFLKTQGKGGILGPVIVCRIGCTNVQVVVSHRYSCRSHSHVIGGDGIGFVTILSTAMSTKRGEVSAELFPLFEVRMVSNEDFGALYGIGLGSFATLKAG
ncbi:hypothetical protein [Vibrio campbellii]|uniref:hypothetical protein n=1 Tax=Vibrio campbellii TaxID=680 RepID=UPI00373699D6